VIPAKPHGRAPFVGGVHRQFEDAPVVRAAVQFGQQIAAVAEEFAILGRFRFRTAIAEVGDDPRQQPGGQPGEVVEGQAALPLLGAAAADGDQPCQASIGGPIGGPKDDRGGVAGREFRADEEFQSAELRHRIEVAVNALPSHLKSIFVLREVWEMSTKDTAGQLGVSIPTAKTRLHRARKVY